MTALLHAALRDARGLERLHVLACTASAIPLVLLLRAADRTTTAIGLAVLVVTALGALLAHWRP